MVVVSTKPMTKASIGILNNNTITTVYCDDLDQEVLVKYYTDLNDVSCLIQWGDISSLSFEQVNYYSEDGYSSSYSRTFDSVDEMIMYYNACGCKYCCVFETDHWNVYKINRKDGSYKLTEAEALV